MEARMEVSKNIDTTVRNKIQSVYIVKKCIIELVQKMFADPSSSDDVSFKHIAEVHLYLKFSKNRLVSLQEALLNKRYVNNVIELEVQQVIYDLKKNITLLEGKMKMYKQSIEEKNKEIEISNLEKYFQDPDLFKSLSSKIMLVYEDPSHNANYGRVIHEILTDLGKFQGSKDSKKLNRYVIQCETSLEEVKKYAKCLDESDNFQIEKDDVVNIQRSLESLLEMCRILMSNIE